MFYNLQNGLFLKLLIPLISLFTQDCSFEVGWNISWSLYSSMENTQVQQKLSLEADLKHCLTHQL